MGKKLTTLLTAGLATIASSALIIGATYALWGEDKTITNHLSSGSFDANLYRVSYTKVILDDDGAMKTVTNLESVDFSTATSENVFGIEADEKIAPGSSYEAVMQVKNEGNVAFSYDVTIVLDASNALAEQLELYVDGVSKGKLSDYVTSESSTSTTAIYSATVAAEADSTFTIKLVFVESSDNNTAQNQSLSFDLHVAAVQNTSNSNT